MQSILIGRLSLDPKEHPILFTEPSLHNKENRLKLTRDAFEKYQIPALFICKSSVLTAFSNGRSTALVLESGANCTYSVPVHDGYALQTSTIRCDIGGNFITEEVAKVLEAKGIKDKILPPYAYTKKIVNSQTILEKKQNLENTHPSYENYCKFEIIRDIKESLLKFAGESAMETYFINCLIYC
jgi:actin-related protein